MSREGAHHMQSRPSRPFTTPTVKRKHSHDISQLDAKLKLLVDNVLPKQPYIISVPSDVPYHHSSRFVNTWHVGTPFSREEEQLQYMSFLPHQEEEESALLKAVGGWSDEQGNMLQEESTAQQTYMSGPSTPLSGPKRKKITLSDYKNKGAGGSESVEHIPSQESTKPRTIETAAEKVRQKVNGVSEVVAQHKTDAVSSREKAEITESKKRTHGEAMRSPEPVSQVRAESPRPEKKARKVSQSRPQVGKSALKPAPELAEDNKTVPQLLSPTLPPEEKGPEVPHLLSPTLPPPIEELLATELEKPQLNGLSGHVRTDSVKVMLATAGLSSSPRLDVRRSPAIRAETGGTRNRNRSTSQASARSIHSTVSFSESKAIAKSSSPVPSALAREPVKALTPRSRPNGVTSSPGPRQRHTINLKYGKKNRKRVEALLKFAPREKKPSNTTTPLQKTSVEQTRPRAASDPKSADTRSTKKSHDSQSPAPGPAAKRQKKPPSSPSLADKPHTPVSSSFKSPSVQNNLQPRSTFTTPKKELKSTAMRRVESSEGIDARTPTGVPTRHSTPISIERSVAAIKTSPPPTSAAVIPSREEERRAWWKIHTKYFELGRTIKKDGTTYGASPSSDPNSKEAALSVVLLIESLSCFMINLTALTNHNPASDDGWRTILPLHIFIYRASRKFSHLHGLVILMGAVCRQIISKVELDRLAREPLPDEHGATSAPTPGSDGTTKTTDDSEKHKKKYIDFRNALVNNVRELQTAWLDGSRKLSIDTLKQEYPKTWANRAKDTTLRNVEKLSPAKLGGEFFLPLDVNTSAIEAVRFVVTFLREWADKEGVDWKPRIEL